MNRLIGASALSVLVLAGTARAMEINPLVREHVHLIAKQTKLGERPVRVQVSVNFFISGPANEGDEAMTLRARARRMIYQFAAGECEVVKEVFADTCRLDAVSVSVNRQVGQTEGFMVNGNITLMTTLK